MPKPLALVTLLALVAVGAFAGSPARASGPIAVPANWVRVAWSEATGPVEGYAVYVSRDGATERLEQHVLGPSAVIVGSFGETLELRVAAFDAEGNLGPLSPVSAAFYLVRPTEDADGDGWTNAEDTCPLMSDLLQWDLDLDGVGDACDACPLVADAGQADVDGDGFGDACECGDASGDGRVDTIDARLVQLCSVGALTDPEICTGACDATGDDWCDTSDARIIELVAVGVASKRDLACSLRP